jgi:hypothetical protein
MGLYTEGMSATSLSLDQNIACFLGNKMDHYVAVCNRKQRGLVSNRLFQPWITHTYYIYIIKPWASNN